MTGLLIGLTIYAMFWVGFSIRGIIKVTDQDFTGRQKLVLSIMMPPFMLVWPAIMVYAYHQLLKGGSDE